MPAGLIVLITFSTAIEVLLIFITVKFFKKLGDFKERGKHTKANVVNVDRKGKKWYIYTVEYMVDDKLQTAKCTPVSRYWHNVGETAEIACLPEDPERVMLVIDNELAGTQQGILYAAMCALFLFYIALIAILGVK